MPADRIWIKNPLALFTANDTQAPGGLVVENGVIIEMLAAGASPTLPVNETFDAREHVVLPGLVNTHHHFYQTLTRAWGPVVNEPLFNWLLTLYPVWARLTPEALQLASKVALAELLLSGCTTAADHHYLFPGGLEDAIDIQVEAVRELGMRAMLTRGSMNLSKDDGGLPCKSVVQDAETILADEQEFCAKRFGMRTVDYLQSVGWLGPRTWLAHGIHFNQVEIHRLGAAGVGICHCPSSNMRLASGICHTLELEDKGAIIGLGVDGSASNDASNMMLEARQALFIGRLRYGAEKITPEKVLGWATRGSARLLGRSDIGELAVGKQADLALFKLDELRFSGSHDPVAALLLCAADRADRVMVGGKWRVVDGQVEGLDVQGLIADHQQAARQLVNG